MGNEVTCITSRKSRNASAEPIPKLHFSAPTGAWQQSPGQANPLAGERSPGFSAKVPSVSEPCRGETMTGPRRCPAPLGLWDGQDRRYRDPGLRLAARGLARGFAATPLFGLCPQQEVSELAHLPRFVRLYRLLTGVWLSRLHHTQSLPPNLHQRTPI
jgi:hypothetical protein